MIGLGFKPFHAAALNLIANTAPVAWGAIGTPVHMLTQVTGLPEADMNAMIGRILPITALIVPFWLVRAMVPWKETFEVFPAIAVVSRGAIANCLRSDMFAIAACRQAGHTAVWTRTPSTAGPAARATQGGLPPERRNGATESGCADFGPRIKPSGADRSLQ